MFEIGDYIKYNGLVPSSWGIRKDLTISKIYIVKDKGKRPHDIQYTVVNDDGKDLVFDETSPIGKGFEKVKKELNFLEILKGY